MADGGGNGARDRGMRGPSRCPHVFPTRFVPLPMCGGVILLWRTGARGGDGDSSPPIGPMKELGDEGSRLLANSKGWLGLQPTIHGGGAAEEYLGVTRGPPGNRLEDTRRGFSR